MALKIRLARRGSKKRPFYHVVLADSRMPRDGRYLEKLGTYNPLLPKDSEERIQLDMQKVKAHMANGAQPTDRVARFLEATGELDKKERNNPKKGEPGQAAKDRAEAKTAKEAEAAAAPVVEEVAPVEEAAPAPAAEEAPAEEAKSE